MSEDITQELGELTVTQDSEAGSESASTTSTGEESSLDLEPKSQAEDQKEKQILSLMRKIDSGELTMDDLKKSKQKWAAEEIEKRQALAKREAEKAEELDVDAIVERKLKEKQEDRDFESLKADLEKQGLSSEEREVLTSEYKELRQAGLSKLVALQKAKQLAGIGSEKARPTLSVSSRTVKEDRKVDSIEEIMRLPEAQRVAALKKLTL